FEVFSSLVSVSFSRHKRSSRLEHKAGRHSNRTQLSSGYFKDNCSNCGTIETIGVSLISSPIQEAGRLQKSVFSFYSSFSLDIDCSAMFVLVIEKDATFQKILSSSLYRDFNPCLFLTAKGYPDLATRSFLSMLCDKYPALPVYALVDADPHGIGIYLNYKYGSQVSLLSPSLTV
ncbi:unnamed protein product, partial [Schistocephalus solidus]|uniref:TP6A_N domain-containing protein n=1 Tax=Schistocephalus solidus TaxID=70667 RepID=A0A183SND3_SCHSO